MKRLLAIGLFCATLLPVTAWSFCGFYVAKGGSDLFNQSSQVVYVRDGDRSIVTMGSDFKGDVKEFAMIVPVPVVVQKDQVKLVNNKTIEALDAYTAPRLVEYFDANPCGFRDYSAVVEDASSNYKLAGAAEKDSARSLGVTIEASYTLGEYDILVLSAQESGGLITWLNQNNYKIPTGAEDVINSYLKQNMKFFIAKVNLQEYSKTGFTKLRPIQVSYSEKRFMLPIRLGTVNADGKQDLFIYALTREGRVETTNYRTIKIPTDINIPAYIKAQNKFSQFYQDAFSTTFNKDPKGVFLEYGWDMSWCDPCAADPLNYEELRELGVFWLPENRVEAYVTRLHVRYDRESFPEDLAFQITGNRENFQGRYIIQNYWEGDATCSEATDYFASLPSRFEKEAQSLARLTNWNINSIRKELPKIKK